MVFQPKVCRKRIRKRTFFILLVSYMWNQMIVSDGKFIDGVSKDTNISIY